MSDETPELETKDLPHGYAPAPTPNPDVVTHHEQGGDSAPEDTAQPAETKPATKTSPKRPSATR